MFCDAVSIIVATFYFIVVVVHKLFSEKQTFSRFARERRSSVLFILVTGTPHAGKSMWLDEFEKNHPDARMKIIDIYHVQNQFVLEDDKDILSAYIAMMTELKLSLKRYRKNHGVVLVEAPLFTKEDRALFIDVFNSNKRKEDESVLIWCETNPQTLRKRFDMHDEVEGDVEDILSKMERPIDSEGCDHILYHDNVGAEDIYENLARIHCGYCAFDEDDAKRRIEEFERSKNRKENYSRGITYMFEEQNVPLPTAK